MSSKRKKLLKPEKAIDDAVRKLTDYSEIVFRMDKNLWEIARIVARGLSSPEKEITPTSRYFLPYLKFIQDTFGEFVVDAIKNSDLAQVYKDLVNGKIDIDEVRRHCREREERHKRRT